MRKWWMASAAVLASAAPVFAAEHSDLATRFGARELIQQISLSPDGTRVVAIFAGADQTQRVGVFSIVDPSKKTGVLAAKGTDREHLDYCDWASADRLVCGFSSVLGRGGDAIGFGRLVTLKDDGSELKLLTNTGGGDALELMQDGGRIIDWLGDDQGGGLLMTRQFVPTAGTGTLIAENRSGLGVEHVDPATLKRQVVEAPRADAREYISDAHGVIRIVGVRPKLPNGYDAAHIDYLYRQAGQKKWLPLSRVDGDSQTEAGFDPYAVDRDLNIAYGFDEQEGRRALFKIALDGSLKRELVYANPNVDVDGLIRIGRQHRVVGVTYATDRRQTEFFDPELKRLQVALGRALPDQPLVSFVDASADESKLLLWTGSDVDPGHYGVFDKKTRHLDMLIDARPDLNGMTLAPVKSVTFPAADGTLIPAYLTLPVGSAGKGFPTIVMPHGGPSARDEWGFDWLVQYFVARGFAVLQPNFRGSTGYGNAWFEQNGFKSWKTAIGDVNDGGRWLVKQGIADPAKLAIVGWSYGGYAALQSAVLDPDLFKAIVAVAPVTDLDSLRQEHENYTDYKLVDAFIGRGAHVHEGSPAQNAARFKAPVLMFHGDRDANVFVAESRLMKGRLEAAGKKVDYVEFKGLDHQLDDGDARAELLDRSDAFLRASMGMK